MKIAPIVIVCKERYAKTATIMLRTYAEFHRAPIHVIVDSTGYNMLKEYNSERIVIVKLQDYRDRAIAAVRVENKDFEVFDYEGDGDHDRVYSSLKPVIMDLVIQDMMPDATHILSLDADALFSGNILRKVKIELNKPEQKDKDIYMVAREDPRMLRPKKCTPGSGFTLWRRDSKFIPLFKKHFVGKLGKFKGGGSQSLINHIRRKLKGVVLQDPLLHFVSPDLNNKHFSDIQIKELKPAYIHLHGKDSYSRLLRFRRVLEV